MAASANSPATAAAASAVPAMATAESAADAGQPTVGSFDSVYASHEGGRLFGRYYAPQTWKSKVALYAWLRSKLKHGCRCMRFFVADGAKHSRCSHQNRGGWPAA